MDPMSSIEPPLIIVVKQVYLYGNRVYYPICAKAKVFAEIARTKTLTIETLRLICRLGYTVDKVPDEGIPL